MKKISTVAMLLALFLAPVAMGATTEEQKTVPDESQGLLINGFWDNWFISIDGGASVFFSPWDENLEFTKRIAPNASLNVGKWWTPVFGTRLGLDYMSGNCATIYSDVIGYQSNGLIDGFDDLYQQRFHGLRPHVDGMVDLINLFGGYSPTRVYSLIVYGGLGYGYGWSEGEPISDGFWSVELRGGLINSFHVSDAIDINVEFKVSKYDSGLCGERRGEGDAYQPYHNLNASANVGIAYNFRERGWKAPVVPVYEPIIPKYSDAEGDALVQRLQDANNRIKDLENDLAAANEALAKALEDAANKEEEPAVTVYYAINKSNIRSSERDIVKAVADAIKATPDTKYVITGYADKQTGTDEINARLREERAQSVYKLLVRYGVNPDQLTTTTDTKPLNKFNYVLDRAATIKVAK